MAQIAAGMRDIAAQNMAMRELLMQAQGHQMPQGSHPVREIPLSHSRGHTSRHTECPLEREGNTEATSYMQESHPSEPPLGDNFPQHNDQTSVSVFDRIGNDPSNRIRPSRGSARSDNEEEYVPPPRNRKERRNLVDWGSRGKAPPPSQDVQDDQGSEGPCRSYEIDDDDDNLPFSREIRSFPMPTNFMPPKIPKYEGKGDPEKHLTKYMTQMSLRGASPALKCRAFHLTLGRAAEVTDREALSALKGHTIAPTSGQALASATLNAVPVLAYDSAPTEAAPSGRTDNNNNKKKRPNRPLPGARFCTFHQLYGHDTSECRDVNRRPDRSNPLTSSRNEHPRRSTSPRREGRGHQEQPPSRRESRNRGQSRKENQAQFAGSQVGLSWGVGQTGSKRSLGCDVHLLSVHEIPNRTWDCNGSGDQMSSRACYLNSLRKSEPQTVNVIQAEVAAEAGTDVEMLDAPEQGHTSGQEEDVIMEEAPEQGHPLDELDPRIIDYEPNATPMEELETFPVNPEDPNQVLRIGKSLSPEAKIEMIRFLKENLDVFAWKHEDMVGIDPRINCHHLNINPSYAPHRQKRRALNPERYEALKDEVSKLDRSGFIREAIYPRWISNPVLVKKSSGKWRVCVDFTNLNKACPKDSFPLPRIDQLVNSTAGHELLSFMDAYSGYNQIPMFRPDEEATSFITDRGLYCYKVMPFGLKNAGATYQRLVNMMFAELICKTMEVYVDDMLVKSLQAAEHVSHIDQTFQILRRYNMKLNPLKCTFGVASGQFLGYIVNQRGIEANPAKVAAIIEMSSPQKPKEVQSLNGRIAALSRFISRATDKSLPFFKVLKQGKKFQWTSECQEAFESLKKHLGELPLLSKPHPDESLLLYLAVSDVAVSAVLTREENERQLPVYYISKALLPAETRYSDMEKLALALIIVSRKLRPYFQAHSIQVLTNFPLRQVMQKTDASGRLLKWAIELSEFDLTFRPRHAIKGQALADFMVEFTKAPEMEALMEPAEPPAWKLFVDGSSGEAGAGARIVLESPEGHLLKARKVIC
ncbi:uncharacterized protein LOC111403774 [Olea europaea var. sylvestris]|uniref:uncharacterized protein LOC111403774 n=1 Tax=Olea europaea var. sylvestris TaxID=158386 RepID=UPI000C1CFB96|nr:uncharacterized protein LOC111403774 [Olea europaea var. sylvestris]